MHANKTKFERNIPLAVRVLIFSLQKKINKTKTKKRASLSGLLFITMAV